MVFLNFHSGKSSNMDVNVPPGEQFEVDDDYTPIYVSPDISWRWEPSFSLNVARLRAHNSIWGIGWRPETHRYFPASFQESVLSLIRATFRMKVGWWSVCA
jgi:hypothetical protein